MTGALVRRRALGLDARLHALEEAASYATDRLDPGAVGRARSVLERAGRRLGLGSELTVAALAGATGSGKSSLFNALAGAELSRVGVRRPTTGETHACVWEAGSAGPQDTPGSGSGDEGAGPLLDWLGVQRRHRRAGSTEARADDGAPAGLVLLDLPDFDSTEVSHRLEADRLVELVDLLVWVVDPQKYADAALHERYLRPLNGYAGVMVVVLNQVDRLDHQARRACATDLRRLLAEDGLGKSPSILASALTGEGLGELRGELERRAGARRAAAERLAADVERAASDLRASCGPKAGGGVTRADRAVLVAALGDAAGIEVATAAVAGSHRRSASLATGWPFTRWLARLKPDPLRRLHLRGDPASGPRTSLPEPTPVQTARVSGALRSISDSAAAGLADPWPRLVRRAAERDEPRLPDRLDQVVAGSGIEMARSPRWWTAVGGLQTLLAAAAVVGALWLGALFVVAWLQLPDPPLPRLGGVPVPTVALLGGLLAGAVVAFVSRLLARAGARRRAGAARRLLLDRIGVIADDRILGPVRAELEAYDRLCTAARRAETGRA